MMTHTQICFEFLPREIILIAYLIHIFLLDIFIYRSLEKMNELMLDLITPPMLILLMIG